MDLHFGTRVSGRAGDSVGQLLGVVYDPKPGQAVSLVVERAGFDERRLVVPIGAVDSADRNRVELALSRDQFDALPNFADGRNMAPPPMADNLEGEDDIPPENVPDVPSVGAATGVESIAFTPIVQETRHVPGNGDVIDGETSVWATDGELGRVADVLVDEQTNRITGFVVEKGLIFKHDLEVPIDAVANVNGGTIVLNLDRQAVGARQHD